MSSAAGNFAPRISEWMLRHPDLPRLELELLACHHLGIDRAKLIATRDWLVGADEARLLARDAARLQRGEPLAYVIGERAFWNFVVEVTPDVLIPRPETETLVEQALLRLQPGDRVLDLGTGSGAIAIALAAHTSVPVLAVDQSSAALEVAARNVARLDANVVCRSSDWFAGVPESFELIVANPPYVAAGDPHLDALRYEPEAALVSGARGLDDLHAIITTAPSHLVAGGWLLVEHGYDQAAAVQAFFAAAGFGAIETIDDLGGQPRVGLGRWSS